MRNWQRQLLAARHRSSAAPWYLSGGISAANCVGAYLAKGAASLAASYVNLANPGTYDLTLGVAPSWAAGTGWTFNGSTQFLNTGITPATGWSVMVRVANRTLGENIPIGSGGGTTRCYVFFGNSVVYYANGDFGSKAGTPTSGVFGVAGQVGYQDGSPVVTGIGAWSGVGAALSIGKHTSFGYFFPGDILAAAVYNTVLDGATVGTLSTAIAAL